MGGIKCQRTPECAADKASLCDDLPSAVRIEAEDAFDTFFCIGSEVLFVNDAGMADDEGLHARLGVAHGPGDQGKACNHVTVDDIVVATPGNLIALGAQYPEAVAEVALPAFDFSIAA